MENNIVKLIRTVEEQNESINLIEKLLENTYKDKLDTSMINVSNFSKNLGKVIYDEIKAQNIETNREKVEKFLDSLLVQIRGLNSLKITIAIPPNENLIANLSNWAVKNLSQDIIFDIQVDPQILGGAIITSNEGLFEDLSVSKKINEYFLAEKQRSSIIS